MATFSFDYELNLIEAKSIAGSASNYADSKVEHLIKTGQGTHLAIANAYNGYDNSFVMIPFADNAPSVDVTALTHYEGFPIDALRKADGNF